MWKKICLLLETKSMIQLNLMQLEEQQQINISELPEEAKIRYLDELVRGGRKYDEQELADLTNLKKSR